MKITAADITLTPGVWTPENGTDPAWRYMVLTVTGAAPGRWTVRNNAPGWYLHLKHDGHHVATANWNDWDAVKALIAHESGPYIVAVACPVNGPLDEITGLTLASARLTAYRAQEKGCITTVTDGDGNEISFPRRPDTED